METQTKKIELLSPAKNADIGMAAIDCGADAVYIAAKKFGAREDAGNLLHDIQKLIAYAHKYYGRVYIALNTILRNDELDEALKIINDVYSIGADGLIIQDLGLLELDLPPVPLMASTQMNNDSLEKILFLQNIGFKRVILPREMTLDQIKEIREKTTVEFESFVHGSLCVSYSGQCYLSYCLGGRSANRGACAQPCRHSYSLVNERPEFLARNKYLLSMKDLNRSVYLKDLVDAGVTSFKIEGRLKDKAYVANITSFYRKKLDALVDKKTVVRSSSGKMSFEFTPDPYKTFNRGFTDYGLKVDPAFAGFRGMQHQGAQKEELAALYTPKSLGEKIGTIAKVGKDFFTLSTKHDLKNGDGLCFFDHSQVLRGTLINKVQNDKVYPDKMYYLEKGTLIYRNYDKAFARTLEKTPCRRRISVTFLLEETKDGLKLGVRDEDDNIGTSSLSMDKVKAEKKELAESAIKNQLSKLNDTIFECKNIIDKCKDVYFVPFSSLNQLRRGAIDNLLVEREKNRPRVTGAVIKNDIPYPVKNITYLGNCLNSKAERFYERHGAQVTELAAENGLDMSQRRVMITKYCVKKELSLCGQETGALYLVDEEKRRFFLKFNCKECVMEIFAPLKKGQDE